MERKSARIIYVLCIGFIFTQITFAEVEKDISFAEALFEEKDYYRAISEYKRYIFYNKDSPQISYCLFKIGECYQRSKKWFEAVDSFKKVIQNYPKSIYAIDSRYQIGLTYYRAGLTSLAISNFEVLNTDIPDNPYRDTAQYLIGVAYIDEMKWDDASREFNKLILNYPESKHKENALKLATGCEKGKNLPKKSPVLAGCLSIFPGLGQIYSDRYKDGLNSFIINGLFGYLTYYSYYIEKDKDIPNYTSAYIFGTIGTIFYLANIYGAINSARNANLIIKINHRDKLKNEAQIDIIIPFK